MYVIKVAFLQEGQSASTLQFVEVFRSDNPDNIVEEWKHIAQGNFYRSGAKMDAADHLDKYLSTPGKNKTFVVNGKLQTKLSNGGRLNDGYGLRLRIEKVPDIII